MSIKLHKASLWLCKIYLFFINTIAVSNLKNDYYFGLLSGHFIIIFRAMYRTLFHKIIQIVLFNMSYSAFLYEVRLRDPLDLDSENRWTPQALNKQPHYRR